MSRESFLVGFFVLSGFASAYAQQNPRITILSYNIHIGIGTDEKQDLGRVAKIIRSANPDLVSLQEVDRKARRTSGVDQAAELARLTRLRMVFGKALDQPGIDLDGGEYGVAILSRLPIRWYRIRALPFTRGYETRAVLETEMEWSAGAGGPTPLRFYATHFDNASADDRLASAKMLVELAGQNQTIPSILAGDLNAVPGSEPLNTLATSWEMAGAGRELPTFPATGPNRQIDYVLFRPAERWKVVETRVIDEPVASDHRPILAVLELTPGNR